MPTVIEVIVNTINKGQATFLEGTMQSSPSDLAKLFIHRPQDSLLFEIVWKALEENFYPFVNITVGDDLLKGINSAQESVGVGGLGQGRGGHW